MQQLMPRRIKYHNSPIYVDQMPLLLYYGEAGCAVIHGALDGWKL